MSILSGAVRFAVGLGKKVLVANVLGEFVAEVAALGQRNLVLSWAYAAAVSLQIYFDFSGYSDMAIGLGSILGFSFPENFRYPFIAKSVSEFWRRWHMTLGAWFRDYVYIPMGEQGQHVQVDMEYPGGLAVYRALAWGRVEFYCMGTSVCRASGV